ncbi:MAG: TIGR00268 family protein, partial [Draconibacterium sp.]|nr:TIGR00268 family protein [Draconibacterium sp.]
HKITKEKLQQIEDAENILNDYGFKDVRVRHYGVFGQIEVKKDELEKLLLVEDEVVRKIRNVGFDELKIDREGLVSGKLNRVLKINKENKK